MTKKIEFKIFDRDYYLKNKDFFIKSWCYICVPHELGRFNSGSPLFQKFGIDYKWDFYKDNDCLPIEYWEKLNNKQRQQLNEYNYNWEKDGFNWFFSKDKINKDEFYKDEISQFYVILFIDNKPVTESGFVILKDNSAIIHGLETAPNHRKKGYASLVIEKGLEILKIKGVKKIKSRVNKRNENSIILHKRNCFNLENENDNFYFFEKEI